MRDSAGIEIVVNELPAWSPEQVWMLDPDPLVDIGASSQSPELFRIEGIVALGDRIAVVNASSSQVLLFDGAGSLLRTVGRRGQGPGEFSRLRGVFRCGGDTLLVDDVSRVMIFDVEGVLVRTYPVVPTPGEDIGRIAAASADCGTVLARGNPSPAPGSGQVGRRSSTVFWSRLGRAERDTIGQFAGQALVGVVIEGVQQALYQPWGADGVSGAAGDRFYYGSSEAAGIRVFAREHGLVRVIRWPVEPHPISTSDRDRYSEKRDWLLTRFPQGAALMPRLEEVPEVPRVRPVFRSILIDDASNVWVRKYPDFIAGRPDLFDRDVPLRYTPPPGELPETYWIFDDNGRWLGEVETPAELVIRAISRDKVIGVWRDSLDVEHVRIYRLVRPAA